MKSATEEEKNGLQELWRFEGETLSTEQSRIHKKKNQERFYKTTLPATKIRFSFSTERTAGDPPEENTF